MNPESLKQLLGKLSNTDIEELRLEQGDLKLYFRKGEVPAAAVPPPPAPKKAAAPAGEDRTKVPIKSPMVGTFYHSASADHPPFVIEGNHIVPGQKVGIIEAMKINKDVTASIKGRIVKVSVRNGQSVEYGQELFVVDTTDEGKK